MMNLRRTDKNGKNICIDDRVYTTDGCMERVTGWTEDGFVIHGRGDETRPEFLERV